MNLLQELRLAARNLRRTPGFTAVAVAVLALGIGVNAAIFSLVSSVMLAPSPYRQAERIYSVYLEQDGSTPSRMPQRLVWSYPKFQTLRQQRLPFSSLAGFADQSFNWSRGERPQRVNGEFATASYFDLLGQQPLLGRTYSPDEDSPAGESSVVVLSEGLWRREFGARPDVLGERVSLDRKSFTVIGVLPAEFRGLSREAELWVPLAAARILAYPEALEEEHYHWFEGVARLEPGVATLNLEQVAAAGRAVEAAHPVPAGFDDGTHYRGGAKPLAEARRDPLLRRALLVLFGAVGAVLLIACANLAHLLLVRGAGRRRELAVRTALGSTRWRLVRQLLLESLLLAGAGALLGLVLASWAVELLASLRPEALGGWGILGSESLALREAQLDGRVMVFGVALALLVPLAIGLGPALSAVAGDLSAGLKEGGAVLAGGLGTRRRRSLGRGLLVAGQLALAFALLVGAGLLVRSFAGLARLELGFAPEKLLTAQLSPAAGEYDQASGAHFQTELIERLEALPGVVSASLASCAPVSSRCNHTRVTRLDGRELEMAAAPGIGVHFVTPGHLATIGARLLAGRDFAWSDRAGEPVVALVSEAAALELWPGQKAVGKHLAVGQGGFRDAQQAEVVGVVRDLHYRGVEEPTGPEIYLSTVQTNPLGRVLFVRTQGDPLVLAEAVRTVVAEINPGLPLYGVRTMEERLGEALSRARFATLLLSLFATLAQFLAALGVYGVLAQAIGQRRREIGLRMALGAERAAVARRVLGQGLALAGLGIAAGLGLALLGTRLLAGLLYGVGTTDLLTFVVVPVLLLATTLAACALPALRAARLEPIVALREE